MPNNFPSQTIWAIDTNELPVCNVAIAGDFLPAMSSTSSERNIWRKESRRLSPYFDDVDVTFVNLESTINVTGLTPKPKNWLGANVSAPEESLQYLSCLKTQVVGLANNHIYDFGETGVERTRQSVLRHGMVPIGVGRSLSDPPEILVYHGPGEIKIGFWAAAKNIDKLATDLAPGVEVSSCKRAIQALKEMDLNGVTVRIALLHLGLERTNHPDPEDVFLIDSFVKLGFDIVAASHSHRISGYNVIPRAELDRKAGIAFYGLGSLSSCCLYSELEREGLLVVVGIGRNGYVVRIEVRPVYLIGEGWGSVADNAASILQRFVDLSTRIIDGSYKQAFYADMAQDLLSHHWLDTVTAFRNGGIRGLVAKMRRLRMRHVRRLRYKLFQK